MNSWRTFLPRMCIGACVSPKPSGGPERKGKEENWPMVKICALNLGEFTRQTLSKRMQVVQCNPFKNVWVISGRKLHPASGIAGSRDSMSLEFHRSPSCGSSVLWAGPTLRQTLPRWPHDKYTF